MKQETNTFITQGHSNASWDHQVKKYIMPILHSGKTFSRKFGVI